MESIRSGLFVSISKREFDKRPLLELVSPLQGDEAHWQSIACVDCVRQLGFNDLWLCGERARECCLMVSFEGIQHRIPVLNFYHWSRINLTRNLSLIRPYVSASAWSIGGLRRTKVDRHFIILYSGRIAPVGNTEDRSEELDWWYGRREECDKILVTEVEKEFEDLAVKDGGAYKQNVLIKFVEVAFMATPIQSEVHDNVMGYRVVCTLFAKT